MGTDVPRQPRTHSARKGPCARSCGPWPHALGQAVFAQGRGSGSGVRIGSTCATQVLERGREDERLAQVLRVLVHGEARAERRDLEEDAARLAEVDRAEPEAVDDRRRAAGRRRRRARARPRARPSATTSDVVRPCRRRRARAPPAARRRRRARRGWGRVPPRLLAPAGTKPSVSSSTVRLASGATRERADGVETLERMLGGHLRVLGDRAAASSTEAHDEPVAQPSGSSKSTPPSSRVERVPARPRAALPEVERCLGADAPLHVCTIPAPAARAARRGTRRT